MNHDIRYSPATSALLLAMTALQTQAGVAPRAALGRAHDIWREHETDSWEASELLALVDQLTTQNS